MMWLQLISTIDEMADRNEIDQFDQIDMEKLREILNGAEEENNEEPQIKRKEVICMKATGIVRRIDDLGRVVIPREIRRNLKIKEGDPLELFTTREGEVVFKKYSYANEHDWAKVKAIIKALYPDLQFALYNNYGDIQKCTKAGFPQSIDFDDRKIKNNEHDTIGYIKVDSDIPTEDLEKIIKVLKEFFSEIK